MKLFFAVARPFPPLKVCLAALAVIPLCAWAGYSSTSLIDIPESEYLDHFQYEADFILAASASPDVSNYGVLSLNLGVGGMSEVGVSAYSVWEDIAAAAHFKVEVFDEEHYGRFQPAVSIGMDNLTLGDGEISHAGRRLPADTASYDMDFKDNISPYVVASKTFDEVGTFHVGWGAGRFIGAGPHSKYVHGIFAGYHRRIWGKFEIMVEEDGRDVNVGVRHTLPWLTVGTAIEKAEQLGSDSFHPYYTLTVEYSPRVLHRGPERLALRRRINDLHDMVYALQGKIENDRDAAADLKQEIDDAVKAARASGVDDSQIRAVYSEIDRLQSQIQALEQERTKSQPNPPLGVEM